MHLAYNGRDFAGWQRQPHALAVQQVIEEALTLMVGEEIEIVGCGRTDAGVHASTYVAHFDAENPLPQGLDNRLNKYLPPSIAIRQIEPVGAERHARFDATYRAYEYYISLRKDPFRQETAYFYPQADQINRGRMQEAAALLLDYAAFFPFCKTGSDAKTMNCRLFRSEWTFEEDHWRYDIAADRFLRGMVRLCVGMCLNVGSGKTTLEEVRTALDRQERLKNSWSVAPEGLFLAQVRYN